MKVTFISFVLLLFFAIQPINAAPHKEYYVVDDDTKSCASVSGGDECVTVEYDISSNWKSLEPDRVDMGCPADYQIVSLPYIVKPHWQTSCLIPGHSGSSYTFNYFWFRIVPITLLIFLSILWLIRRYSQTSPN